ncbi:MAG TPA: hypothetical protein VMT88_01390 [Actinomycetes bacterium]|nr:hypothetical protein [Actinomycetes bacterium]
MPEGGITDYLSRQLGRTIVVGVHLGPPRANRKPVLALTTPEGDVVGFAKLGVNELTDRLVANEASALQQLSSLREVTTPRLLLQDSWSGHSLVLQSALLRNGRAADNPEAVANAQVEVSRSVSSGLSAEEYADRLVGQLQVAMPAATSAAAASLKRVQRLVESLRQAPRLAELEMGCWHGDWRATNMAVQRTGVLVWDWERFASGVPVGFDALHLLLTQSSPTTKDLSQLAPLIFRRAPEVLLPFAIRDVEGAEVVTTLYFLELAARYLEDQQATAGTRLGDVDRWLLPELERRVGTAHEH